MGSLMAGWGSDVPDPKHVKLARNKSVTREEIGAFWRTKKEKEEEHLRDLALLSPRTKQMIFEEAMERCEGANAKDLEKIIQKNGWWISSNSAFLNEPPVMPQEGAGQRYASQFHVAGASGLSENRGSTGIGA